MLPEGARRVPSAKVLIPFSDDVWSWEDCGDAAGQKIEETAAQVLQPDP
jgi:hypothetical protein